MHYMQQLLAGVAICDLCGRTWELYQVRAEAAICRCGSALTCLDEESDAQSWPRTARDSATSRPPSAADQSEDSPILSSVRCYLAHGWRPIPSPRGERA